MMLASNITGITGVDGVQIVLPSVKPEEIVVQANAKEIPPKENKKVSLEKNLTVEEYVRNYFSDIPVMIEIARCESRFRQHNSSGDVLRGEQNDLDRGVMQINEFYHGEDSKRLGFDILTLEGNTAYARYIFEKYGVQPWSSSSACWGRTTAYSEYRNDLAINK